MPGVRATLPLLDHAAEAKALPGLDLAGRDPARIEIEHDVLLEGAQRQRAGEADAGDDAEHPDTAAGAAAS